MKKLTQRFELRYESARFGTVLCLSADVLRHLRANRQQGRLKTEVGGQLFAELVRDEVRVIRATGPNTTDKRGWAWFRPDQGKQNSEIKGLFEQGLHFVGDWHTHPEREPTPSSWDLESMEDCFKKSRHRLKAFVMVIVGQADFPTGLWVSLHSCGKWERLALAVNEGMTRPS